MIKPISLSRPLSEKTQRPAAKIHRIVRCVTGLSGEPTTNGRLRQRSTATKLETSEVRNGQRQSGRTGLSDESQGQTDPTIDCYKLQRSAYVAGHQAMNSACPVCTGLSGAPVDRKLLLSVQRL
jgi:hypothetical protein